MARRTAVGWAFIGFPLCLPLATGCFENSLWPQIAQGKPMARRWAPYLAMSQATASPRSQNPPTTVSAAPRCA
jgi:hypothetical protein